MVRVEGVGLEPVAIAITEAASTAEVIVAVTADAALHEAAVVARLDQAAKVTGDARIPVVET